MATLVILVGWEISNKCNARVFKSKIPVASFVFACMKLHTMSWLLAGATHLVNLIPRE
jgi:hypothetical protein